MLCDFPPGLMHAHHMYTLAAFRVSYCQQSHGDREEQPHGIAAERQTPQQSTYMLATALLFRYSAFSHQLSAKKPLAANQDAEHHARAKRSAGGLRQFVVTEWAWRMDPLRALQKGCNLLLAVVLLLDAAAWWPVQGAVQHDYEVSGTIFRVPANSYPVFNVTGTSALSLRNVVIDDNTAYNAALLTNQPFQRLLVLPWIGALSPTATAALQHVQVDTNCQTLKALQRSACRTISPEQLQQLHVLPGLLHVSTWGDAQLTAMNVTFTCPLPASTAEQPSAESLITSLPPSSMDCAVGHALDWWQLADFTISLQLAADVVHIVLDTNISLPINYSASADGVMHVYRELHIAQLPVLQQRSIYLNLDYINSEGLWHVTHPDASIHFEGLTFTLLPLGPPAKYPMSLFPWGVWMVSMDRCNPSFGSVVLASCILYTQPETMEYASHWAGEFLSVFPDRAEAAHWYGEDHTCYPTQNRTILQQQIRLKDQNTWIAENATSFGVQYHNTIFTARYAGTLPPGLQLTKLFDDPYTPFNTIAWVTTAAEFVAALRNVSVPNIMLLRNVTVPPELWPSSPIRLQRSVVIAGWPSRCTVLDWEGVSNVMVLGDYNLKIRNLVLMNGGQGRPGSKPQWAANLTLFQWPVTYDWAHVNTFQLQSVTIVVPPSEFRILKTRFQAFINTPPTQEPSHSGGGLAWLQLAQFKNDSCSVPMLTEDGLLGYNVTITQRPFVYPPMNIEVIIDPVPWQTTPLTPPYSQDGERTWKLILAVVLSVAGGLAVVLFAVACVIWRRRHMDAGVEAMLYKSKVSKGAAGAYHPERDPESGGGDDSDLTEGRSVAVRDCSTTTTSGHALPPQGISKSAEAYLGPRHDPLLTGSPGPPRSVSGRAPNTLVLGKSDQSYVGQHSAASTPLGSHGHLLGSDVPQRPSPAYGGVLLPPPHLQQARQISGRTPSGRPAATGQSDDTFTDSFEQAPMDNNQLLINRFDLSPDLQVAASAPDVAQQLKTLVARMQNELGDQEVTITRVIGHGGGGVVYQGLWRGLTVAVKSLVFTVLPSQPMSRRQKRAMTEAAICRTLQHPNIVATYSYDVQELHATRPNGSNCNHSHSDSLAWSNSNSASSHTASRGEAFMCECHTGAAEYKLYIIQEFCDGGTLKSIVDDGQLHMTTAEGRREPLMGPILQLAIDIARGMAHVHSRNIVHGDLTPANVLLKIDQNTDSHFSAKIADFGLSWKLSNGQEHISNARQGTGFYISPEVLHVGIMSKPADVFSFGMVLHEMYHGTPVWRRGHTNLAEAAQVAARRPGLEQLSWSPTCPEPLRNLIVACLHADPQARPPFATIVSKLQAMRDKLWADMGVDVASDGGSRSNSAASMSVSAPQQQPLPVSPPPAGLTHSAPGAVDTSHPLENGQGSQDLNPIAATMRLLQGSDATYLHQLHSMQTQQVQGESGSAGLRSEFGRSITLWPPQATSAAQEQQEQQHLQQNPTIRGSVSAQGGPTSPAPGPGRPQDSSPLSLMLNFMSEQPRVGSQEGGLCGTPQWSLGKLSDTSLLQGDSQLETPTLWVEGTHKQGAHAQCVSSRHTAPAARGSPLAMNGRSSGRQQGAREPVARGLPAGQPRAEGTVQQPVVDFSQALQGQGDAGAGTGGAQSDFMELHHRVGTASRDLQSTLSCQTLLGCAGTGDGLGTPHAASEPSSTCTALHSSSTPSP